MAGNGSWSFYWRVPEKLRQEFNVKEVLVGDAKDVESLDLPDADHDELLSVIDDLEAGTHNVELGCYVADVKESDLA
jgi:hypothetical protein